MGLSRVAVDSHRLKMGGSYGEINVSNLDNPENIWRNWWRDLDGWLPTLAWAFNGWGITSFYLIRNVLWSLSWPTYLQMTLGWKWSRLFCLMLERVQDNWDFAFYGVRQTLTIERLLSVFNKWGSRFLVLASAIGQVTMSTTTWERQKRGNLQKSSVQHTTRNHATNKARWVIDPD
jgi:hypothetical protein